MNILKLKKHSSDSEPTVKINDLLDYCRNVGLDDYSLKYTQPDFYVDNVQLDTSNDPKIREIIKQVDYEAVRKLLLKQNDYDPIFEASTPNLNENKESVENKYLSRYV